MKDALDTLGTKLDYSGGKDVRDAIHLAVVQATAGDKMYPGTHVCLVNGMAYSHGRAEPTIGIVDPFIKGNLSAGEIFWLVLYPRTITGLRHVWTHPAFPDSQEAP